MPENANLDYASPKPQRSGRFGRITRRVLLVGGAFMFLLGCPIFGYCLHFLTGLNYIDGGEGKPITPEDQRTFAFASALPYVGVVLFIAAITLLVYFEYRDRSHSTSGG
jgi:hypothetical protein